MTMVRLAAGLALLLLLFAPATQAAAGSGTLEVDGFLDLPDGGSMTAAEGMVRLVGAQLPALEIQAETVHVERVGKAVTTAASNNLVLNTAQIDEKADHGASRITLGAGEGATLLALRATGPIEVAFDDADVRPTTGVGLARAVPTAGNQCGAATQRCLEAFGVHELRATRGEATIRGDVELLLLGPALVVEESGSRAEYRSGERNTTTGPATTHETAWIVLRATGVTATLRADEPLSWYAQAPTLEATHAFFPAATGGLEVGALRYRASQETVEARGQLIITPDPVPAGDHYGENGEPVYAEGFATALAGDVQTLSLRATPVFTDSPAETAGYVALLSAVGAILAYYWPLVQFHATAAGLPFYTRLKKPEILDNEVRNHIYDIIRQNPGISAREVHRRSDQSWGTVVYHLRQLERHHLVVSRALGRTRNYYENHGKYRGMEVQLACLQSPRARALAHIILQQPGVTQEILVESSGYPQPTTSYYVRKLKKAGLVTEHREGRYVRYRPEGELARFVQLAETTPDAGSAATA